MAVNQNGERGGILRTVTCLFSLLNALEASTRINASLSWSAKNLVMACAAAPHSQHPAMHIIGDSKDYA